MTINDLRFGYEIELKPLAEYEDVIFDRGCQNDSLGIYGHMEEHGLDIDMHWDNTPVFEMKSIGALTFDEMMEHFIILTEFIRGKFIVHSKGGIHIHISMANDDIRHYYKNIVAQYIKYEKYIYDICSYTKCHDGTITHRYNGYCNSLYSVEDCDSIRDLTDSLYGNGYGLNFNGGYDTVEFRMVDSGFDFMRFKSISMMLAQLILTSYDKEYQNYYEESNFYIHTCRHKTNINIIKEFLEKIEIIDDEVKEKLLKLYKYAFKKAKVLTTV